MPRHLFLKFRPIAEKLRSSWYFRALGPKIVDPRLWGVNRRAITTGFRRRGGHQFLPAAGAPGDRPGGGDDLAPQRAHHRRHAVPGESAHRSAGVLLRIPGGHDHPWPQALAGSCSSSAGTGLQTGLGATWKPFLVGCLVCSVVCGYLAYRGLELMWRFQHAEPQEGTAQRDAREVPAAVRPRIRRPRRRAPAACRRAVPVRAPCARPAARHG